MRCAPLAALVGAVALMRVAACSDARGGTRDVAAERAAGTPIEPSAGSVAAALAPAEASAVGDHGARGTFWVHGDGRALDWVVDATGLAPARQYRIELTVDSALHYAIASARSDEAGRLTIRGVLTAFNDQACVGDAFDAPQSLQGTHRLMAAIKDDGSPAGGMSGGDTPTSGSRRLPCHGNGDGQFTYRLVQQDGPAIIQDGVNEDNDRASRQSPDTLSVAR